MWLSLNFGCLNFHSLSMFFCVTLRRNLGGKSQGRDLPQWPHPNKHGGSEQSWAGDSDQVLTGYCCSEWGRGCSGGGSRSGSSQHLITAQLFSQKSDSNQGRPWAWPARPLFGWERLLGRIALRGLSLISSPASLDWIPPWFSIQVSLSVP